MRETALSPASPAATLPPVLNASSTAFLLAGVDGRIMDRNRRAVQLFGADCAVLTGWGHWREDDRLILSGALRRAQSGGQPVEVECGGHDGIPVFAVTVSPLPPEPGDDTPAQPSDPQTDADSLLLLELRDVSAQRQHEQRHRLILDNIGLAVSLIDENFQFVTTNRAFARLIGSNPEHLWRTTCYANFGDGKQTCPGCPGERALSSGMPERLEKLGRRDDGTPVWIRIHAFPFYEADGRRNGFIEVIEDISELQAERERSDARLNRTRLLFDTMFDGFALADIKTDHSGRAVGLIYRDINPAFERVMKLQRDQIIGHSSVEIFGPLPEFWGEKLAEMQRTGQPQRFIRLSPKAGRYLDYALYPVSGGQVAIVFIDVSDKIAAEAALADSERRYSQMFRHAPVGIAQIGADLRINVCNDRFAEIMQAAPATFCGLDTRNLRDPVFFQTLQRALEGGIGRYRGIYHPTFSGEDIWISLITAPLCDDGGGITGIVAIVEDISGLERAEARVRTLVEVVEQVPVSVVITDTSGSIEYVNQCFCDTTGYQRSEVIGQNPRLLQAGGAAPERYEEMWNTILSGKLWRGEFLNKRKDGSCYVERAAIAPVWETDGQIGHFVGVKEDVTEERRRAQAVERLVDQLRASNTDLERFAYVASHDLREPLRATTSFAQLLKRRYSGKLDQTADEYIGYIVAASMRMHDLINDLLAFSRVTGAVRPLAPVRAEECCALALENLRDAIARSGGVVQAGDLPAVMADDVQLMQLFQNLVGNALKFHKPDLPPRIAITAVAVPSGQWQFQVQDNGIGIERTDQDIFEIFRRLHSSSRYPGTGIGLAICKRIVERHGGRIWVESVAGQGSSFFFTLNPAEGGEEGEAG